MHTHTLVKRFAQVVVSGSLISNTFLPAISKQVLKISLSLSHNNQKKKDKIKSEKCYHWNNVLSTWLQANQGYGSFTF